MYLKSIEVQGFKSFANKIVFDFHNGITGIVGPNGSGKSNVADAVRWVLGEQSAKQLRGAKMEDVIFAGTETRKPVGYAYVSITLDNSDHALAVDYSEVTVTRKVFRSGESEYQLNGHACRLKDITELFYDTGIGKEGYSIIGQGQIDKILSGKPEERRELFDEAAGIVKFKRRKAAAIKKLEHERENLVRVNDILSELEKQVGPLERQSEKAREYLRLRDDLKVRDVNAFLLESDKIRGDLAALEEKIKIAENDLAMANEQYESTRTEYDAIEAQLSSVNNDIELFNTLRSNTEVDKQRLEGKVNVCAEQIKTIEAGKTHYANRISDIEREISDRQASVQKLRGQKEDLKDSLDVYREKQSENDKKHDNILAEIEEISEKIEKNQNKIFEILNKKSNINADNQRFKTILEQLNIKKAEQNSLIIQGKSRESEQDSIIGTLEGELADINEKISEYNSLIEEKTSAVADNKQKIAELSASADKLQQQYHREKSRLESLSAITEKYDGYGNSIRKIMELRSSNKGIIGVIADIVKVEKKYETAIETALGGTIQNIVTDNESTAKGLIAYLKENKFGRATFLPLSSISARNTLEKEPCMSENGVIGVASSLVRVSFEYENLIKYLLGRILVIDNTDNALAVARKCKHTLRIVTLEGEQLNPGGSMTGGAFKNVGNLLGRRREIEELKAETSDISSRLNDTRGNIAELRKKVASIREELEGDNSALREAQLNKNTIQLNLEQAQNKKKEIIASYKDANAQVESIDAEIASVAQQQSLVTVNLKDLDNSNEDSQREIDELSELLDRKKQEEAGQLTASEHIKIEFSALLQKESFIEENIQRIEDEISHLSGEKQEILLKQTDTEREVIAKNREIDEVKSQIERAVAQINDCTEKIDAFKKKRDEMNSSHRVFFEKREKLNSQISELDKEVYRLNSNREKLEENNDNLADYMWNEYELTYSYAMELKNTDMDNLSVLKKEIQSLKASIKNLGDVNVNAIEEFKEVNERYTFLKGQHDDLIEAETSLTQVIDELDNGMRIQFSQKFEEIRREFDKVFKELFGGGRGTIELVEGEDILEAGILIISQPPGKKLQNMMQLSGGEKALTAISLLFAIQNLKPSPFCLLDEIEAALDDSNVGRFANYLHKLTKHTQFIVITHRRGTMAAADRLYGITMQEKGVSALVSVDLIANDLEKEEKAS